MIYNNIFQSARSKAFKAILFDILNPSFLKKNLIWYLNTFQFALVWLIRPCFEKKSGIALFKTVRRLDVTWIWRYLALNLRKNVHFDVPYGVLHLNSSVTVGYKSSNEIDSLIPPPISVTIVSLGSKAAHTAGDRNHSKWLDHTRWEIEIGWRSATELLVVDCKQCRYWCFYSTIY